MTDDKIKRLEKLIQDTNAILIPLLDNSNELGSDEEYEDTVDRLYHEGYADALAAAYYIFAEKEYQD